MVSSQSFLYCVTIAFSYGIYAAGGRISVGWDILLISVLTISIITAYSEKKKGIEISTNQKTMFGLLIVFGLLFFIISPDLLREFSDDPFSHVYLALQPSIQILKILFNFDFICGEISAINTIVYINLLILFIGGTAIFYLGKKPLFFFVRGGNI